MLTIPSACTHSYATDTTPQYPYPPAASRPSAPNAYTEADASKSAQHAAAQCFAVLSAAAGQADVNATVQRLLATLEVGRLSQAEGRGGVGQGVPAASPLSHDHGLLL